MNYARHVQFDNCAFHMSRDKVNRHGVSIFPDAYKKGAYGLLFATSAYTHSYNIRPLYIYIVLIENVA